MAEQQQIGYPLYYPRQRCMCGAEAVQITPNGVMVCRNVEWPHVWYGIGGLTRPTDKYMALELLRLHEEVARLKAESAQVAALRDALEQEHINNSDGLDLNCHTGHCAVCDLIDASAKETTP